MERYLSNNFHQNALTEIPIELFYESETIKKCEKIKIQIFEKSMELFKKDVEWIKEWKKKNPEKDYKDLTKALEERSNTQFRYVLELVHSCIVD